MILDSLPVLPYLSVTYGLTSNVICSLLNMSCVSFVLDMLIFVRKTELSDDKFSCMITIDKSVNIYKLSV